MKLRVVLGFSGLAAVAISCLSRTHNDNVAGSKSQPGVSRDPNPRAGDSILYEIQVRSANACDPNVGSPAQRQACEEKIAPEITYNAEGMKCDDFKNLKRVKLGTIDDMMANTADYREGITLRYIKEKVGANTVWVMPMFPNNDRWNIPDACDNLGSPYAVRDYLHASGLESRKCIQAGRNEYSDTPCWGNDVFAKMLQDGHKRSLQMMLDLAFNHFGHNYLMYDYANYRTMGERIASNEDLDRLWDFDATYEESLLKPVLLDSESAVRSLVSSSESAKSDFDLLQKTCPGLKGDTLVRYFNMWRNAVGEERKQFRCSDAKTVGDSFLEFNLPGFYVGEDGQNPSTHLGDNFTNNWVDVKFLYHHDENRMHMHEYYRNREYLFRVMNYWASQGVDAFRLDHTTDEDSGIDAKDWNYIISKVSYYAQKRGQQRPFFLAEEFHSQEDMRKVVDVMTEGYVHDMRTGDPKDAGRVEWVMNNMDRHEHESYVMTALETHDEHRLVENSGEHKTGYDQWTGAGFWAVGLTQFSTPMLLMGQEFGESWGLGFRKSDFLRSRFKNTDNYREDGDTLRAYYHTLNTLRLAPENAALRSQHRAFLRNKEDDTNENIFAQVKWANSALPIFTFHNLWQKDSQESYYISPQLASQLLLSDSAKYRFFDLISNKVYADCRYGKDIKWELPIAMSAGTRALWLRMESCQ